MSFSDYIHFEWAVVDAGCQHMDSVDYGYTMWDSDKERQEFILFWEV